MQALYRSIACASIAGSLPLQLSPGELDFLTTNSSAALSKFESVSQVGGASEKVLKLAGSQVESAARK